MIARSIAIAIGAAAAVFAVLVVSALLFLPHPQPVKPTTAAPTITDAVVTEHIEWDMPSPSAIPPPPPIKEAEKEGELQSVPPASLAGSIAMVGRGARPAGNPSSSALAEDVNLRAYGARESHAGRVAERPGPEREPVTANTQGQPSGDEASPAFSRAVVARTAATYDPYHDTMLPGGSKWETPISTVPAVPTASVNALLKTRTISATAANTASIPPSIPDWTRCSTSWSQTLSLGKNGEQIWTFSTTLSDADVQDFATSVRWYDDIKAHYPQSVRNYAWLDCAGWRVRDYHLHGSNVPPADFYGAQGLDSPLGTCHSTTPFRRAGAGRCSQQSDELGCSAPGAMSTLGVLGGTKGDDGKVRGWVRWHGDWYVGIVEDAMCTDACVVGFDHPCDLSEETEQPARRWDVAGKMFYSWWYGGDVNGGPPW